jgi:hypothetical protein
MGTRLGVIERRVYIDSIVHSRDKIQPSFMYAMGLYVSSLLELFEEFLGRFGITAFQDLGVQEISAKKLPLLNSITDLDDLFN